MLRAISGLLSTESARIVHGRIQFEGQSIAGWAPDRVARAGVALVPERDKIFATLSVEQNLAVTGMLLEVRVLDATFWRCVHRAAQRRPGCRRRRAGGADRSEWRWQNQLAQLCERLSPANCRIRLGTLDLTGWPVHKVASAGVARTFQHAELFADLTVSDNVMLGRHAHFQVHPLLDALYWGPVRREHRVQRDAIQPMARFSRPCRRGRHAGRVSCHMRVKKSWAWLARWRCNRRSCCLTSLRRACTTRRSKLLVGSAAHSAPTPGADAVDRARHATRGGARDACGCVELRRERRFSPSSASWHPESPFRTQN